MAWFFGHCDEPVDSIKYEEFLDRLNNYDLLMKLLRQTPGVFEM
jgi:hypothetical protein